MNNKEILEKAIHKAIDSGWKAPFPEFDLEVYDNINQVMFISKWYKSKPEWKPMVSMTLTYNDIIFNHNFAKALWGEDPIYVKDIDPSDEWNASYMLDSNAWQYHLQNMVISDNPITYLGANI